jgi:hypothetical protein
MTVKRTERGWAGHFCAARSCLFRRNTLLEIGDIKIVVSTVGNYMFGEKREEIGHEIYFETMAFHAHLAEEKYWDADVRRGAISFDSNWALGEGADDNDANNMHENVVKEITDKLEKGFLFPTSN